MNGTTEESRTGLSGWIERYNTELYRYNFLVTITGAIAVWLCGFVSVFTDMDHVVRQFLFVQAIFLVGCVFPGVEIRRGRHLVKHRFAEYYALVSLFFGPWYLIPPAALIAMIPTAVATWVTRPDERGQIPFAGAVGVISIAFGAFLASVNPPYTFPIGVAAGVLVWDGLSFRNEQLRGEVDSLREWMGGIGTRILTPLASAVIVGGLSFIPNPQGFILLLPTSVLGVWWVAKAVFRYAEDREMWRAMDEASQSLVGVMQEETVLFNALQNGLNVFRASKVIIDLPSASGTSGQSYSIRQGSSVVKVSEHRPIDPPAVDPAQDPPAQRWPRLHIRFAKAAPYTVSAPLKGADRTFGTIHVEWPRPSRLNERGRMLPTFANTVAQSLQGSRTHTLTVNQAQAREHELQRDRLTGLGNRTMLFERGPGLLAESEEMGRMSALLLLDLDGFKRINDTLGHTAGDTVLREVGERIRNAVRRTDLAIRLGGDEFAVLATDLVFPGDAELVAAKINSHLSQEIKVDELNLSVEASIGIAMYGHDANDIETLYKVADVAMYQAKSRGRGQAIRYSASEDANDAELLSLATDLRRALMEMSWSTSAGTKAQLLCHYQPQIDLRTKEICGVEALIRWDHPKFGMLPPSRFVPIAEHSGLIRRFTLNIAKQALLDLKVIHDVVPDITMSVNLSTRNLLDNSLADDLIAALIELCLEPHHLVVEITETAAQTDHTAAEKILELLQAAGIQVSLDDFGTGFSTLDGLRRNSVTEAKIDREFVWRMATSAADRAVVQAIIDMIHAHNRRVVAEGVETVEMLDTLADMGCDVVQGFHIAKPMPLQEFLDWAENYNEELHHNPVA